MTDEASLLPENYDAPIAKGMDLFSSCKDGTNVAGDCGCGSNTGGHDCDHGIIQL